MVSERGKTTEELKQELDELIEKMKEYNEEFGINPDDDDEYFMYDDDYDPCDNADEEEDE